MRQMVAGTQVRSDLKEEGEPPSNQVCQLGKVRNISFELGKSDFKSMKNPIFADISGPAIFHFLTSCKY